MMLQAELWSVCAAAGRPRLHMLLVLTGGPCSTCCSVLSTGCNNCCRLQVVQ